MDNKFVISNRNNSLTLNDLMSSPYCVYANDQCMEFCFTIDDTCTWAIMTIDQLKSLLNEYNASTIENFASYKEKKPYIDLLIKTAEQSHIERLIHG